MSEALAGMVMRSTRVSTLQKILQGGPGQGLLGEQSGGELFRVEGLKILGLLAEPNEFNG